MGKKKDDKPVKEKKEFKAKKPKSNKPINIRGKKNEKGQERS